jgi:hypothetical protein
MTDGRSETEVPVLHEIDPGHLVACHLTRTQRETLRAERISAAAGDATAGSAGDTL